MLANACVFVWTTFAANWRVPFALRPVVSVATFLLLPSSKGDFAASIVQFLWPRAGITPSTLCRFVFVVRVANELVLVNLATNFDVVSWFALDITEVSTETSKRNVLVIGSVSWSVNLVGVVWKLTHEGDTSWLTRRVQVASIGIFRRIAQFRLLAIHRLVLTVAVVVAELILGTHASRKHFSRLQIKVTLFARINLAVAAPFTFAILVAIQSSIPKCFVASIVWQWGLRVTLFTVIVIN